MKVFHVPYKPQMAMVVGRAILPAAAFQAAVGIQSGILVHEHRRLKPGGSQDWLPHFL